MVQWLVEECKVNINVVDRFKRTPLEVCAVKVAVLSCYKLLLPFVATQVQSAPCKLLPSHATSPIGRHPRCNSCMACKCISSYPTASKQHASLTRRQCIATPTPLACDLRPLPQ